MKIFDMHNDFLTEIKSEHKQNLYLNKLKINTITTMALWTSNLTEKEIILACNRANNIQNLNFNTRFAIEDFGFVTKDTYQSVIAANPIYIGLTWNSENSLAGGAFSGGGLTKRGKNIINKLNADKIVIDTAHLNEKSFMETINAADKVICSHTAFSSICKHKRNLNDYQIKMLVDRGGIVGLCLVSDFLSPDGKANINDILNHIEYFLDNYGDDNLALGTDFYGTKSLPKGIKTYDDLEKVQILLTKKGYSDETIAKIFYRNAQVFFNEV